MNYVYAHRKRCGLPNIRLAGSSVHQRVTHPDRLGPGPEQLTLVVPDLDAERFEALLADHDLVGVGQIAHDVQIDG